MKVGDYVRTKKGISRITTIDNEQIRKIIYTDTKEVFEYYTDKQGNEIKDYWKSYSSSIIDLIERFDLVNGHLVICKMYEDEKDIPTIIKCVGDYYFKEEDIKSIVTKEAFESMEYKVNK